MRAPGIIVGVGGVGALALLGLGLLLSGTNPEARDLPAESNTPRSSGPSNPPRGDGQPVARPSVAQSQPARQAWVPPASDSPAVGTPMQTAPASSAGAAASTETSHGARVAEVLETARQAPSEEERLRAVRWLAEHAEPKDFDALQAIQINDPSHEVRNAAEAAVNALRQRHAEAQWPGVPQDVDPQGYMREMRPPP